MLLCKANAGLLPQFCWWPPSISPPRAALAQGTAFTYQGQLQNNGAPASGSYALQFTLYATNATGVPVAGPVTNNPVAVASGLFTTLINFGNVFTGTNYWLDIAVSTNGTNFIELTPRQQLTPVPYAIFAETSSNLSGTVLAAQVSGALSTAQLPASVVTNNASGLTLNGTFNGNGAGVTNVNATSLNGVNASNFWQLAGNNVAPGQFLGSTNFQPVQVLVNGARALSLSPATNDISHSNIVNIVGGSSANYVRPGTYGAVIAGGGAVIYQGQINYSNSIGSDLSSIGGGYENSIQANGQACVIAGGGGNSIGADILYSAISGGYLNSITTINDTSSTIAGGSQNTISAGLSFIGGGAANSIAGGQSVIVGGEENYSGASDSFVGGGFENTIVLNENYTASDVLVGGYNNTLNAYASVLGGGLENVIQSGGTGDTLVGGYLNCISTNTTYAFLGGGYQNTNSGAYSVVPGGLMNYAGGKYSFAAGQQAKANFQGDFVWADSQPTNFSSSANDQFLIRAQGGVGINKTNPAAALDVAGTINGTFFTGNGGGLTNLPAANLTGTFPQSALPATVVTNDESAVTLGSLYVGGSLTLSLPATIDVGGFPALYVDNNNNESFGLIYSGVQSIGSDNTGIGSGALSENSAGSGNTAVGVNALGQLGIQSGAYSNNIAIGYNAGSILYSGNNNIYLGNPGPANNSENRIIRIGTAQTDAYLSGTAHASGGVNVDSTSQNTGTIGANALVFGSNSGEGIASKRTSGGTQYDLEFYTENAQQMVILHNGNVGIGTTNPSTLLEVNGDATVDGDLYAGNINGSSLFTGPINCGSVTTSGLILCGPIVSGPITCSSITSGSNTCSVLTITGGSDLAEPFSISTKNEPVSEGAVVVIDEANPGQLKLTDRAYDTRVAGVVSGANGIHPGIQMHQQGLLDGGRNVALSGRVYVQADTSNGAIQPGDLLTTSSTPGLAMKVTDHAKAEGAILGKAMTGLSEGKGMVLVLVTLQ